MRKPFHFIFLAFFLAPTVYAAGHIVTNPSGLKYEITKEGKGEETAQAGHKVTMRYTGWLDDNGKKGKEFDTSVGRGPFKFTLGEGKVIQGWEEGVAGMKKSEERTLYIPSKLGYGAEGIGPIPGNADLIFDVKLFRFK